MRRTAVLLVAMGLLGAITRGAQADGTIILNSAPAFQTNIDQGWITGATANLTPSSSPQQIASNAALSTAYPTLTKVDSSTAANGPWSGLLNAATPGRQGQYATSWTYAYHIDPDLTNYTINLGMYLPQVSTSLTSSGINTVTIALTSVDSNDPTKYSSRVWGFNNTLTPSVLNPGPGNLEEFSLAAVDGSGAGGSNYFNQDSGFDIQKVLYVSIGYSGMFDSSFPVTPDGSNALWTGAASLDVLQTPEPNSALVLACGLLGAGLLRLAQRARSRRRNRLAC